MAASDAHTEFEAATLSYALLLEYGDQFGREFCDSVFPHEQERENAQAIVSSLPPNFIRTLIGSSLPDTTFKSIIYNSNTFARPDLATLSHVAYDRLKRLFLTYRAVGHLRCVHHICIDPQGILLFTGGDDSLVKVWHTPTLGLICTLKGRSEARRIGGLVMSPDRRLLATWSEECAVRLWSLIDGSCVAIINCIVGESATRGIQDVRFSPCNRFLVIAVETVIRVVRITDLIPCLAEAFRELSEGRDVMASNVLFKSADRDIYNVYDPAQFLVAPPPARDIPFKVPITAVAFSSGGSLMGVGLEDGSVVILSMSTMKHWTFQAHDGTSADGIIFVPNNFHIFLTWSQKGGEAKLWRLLHKSKELRMFSVRKAARRAHLVTATINCDGSLLFACTSASIFAWRIASHKSQTNKFEKPLMHNDDSVIMTQVSDVQAHPFLPCVFLAVTKSVSSPITIWDVSSPEKPIHTLMIPVEMNKVQTARWGADGISVIASDTQGGVFTFRVAEGPECRTMPQFFPTDFTPSVWIPHYGQLEEATKQPSHLQPKSLLLDMDNNKIYDDYTPYTLRELAITPVYESAKKYAWLNEEIWVRRHAMEPEVKPPPAPVANSVEMKRESMEIQQELESTESEADESDTDAKVSEPSDSDPLEGAVDESDDFHRYED